MKVFLTPFNQFRMNWASKYVTLDLLPSSAASINSSVSRPFISFPEHLSKLQFSKFMEHPSLGYQIQIFECHPAEPFNVWVLNRVHAARSTSNFASRFPLFEFAEARKRGHVKSAILELWRKSNCLTCGFRGCPRHFFPRAVVRGR